MRISSKWVLPAFGLLLVLYVMVGTVWAQGTERLIPPPPPVTGPTVNIFVFAIITPEGAVEVLTQTFTHKSECIARLMEVQATLAALAHATRASSICLDTGLVRRRT